MGIGILVGVKEGIYRLLYYERNELFSLVAVFGKTERN